MDLRSGSITPPWSRKGPVDRPVDGPRSRESSRKPVFSGQSKYPVSGAKQRQTGGNQQNQPTAGPYGTVTGPYGTIDSGRNQEIGKQRISLILAELCKAGATIELDGDRIRISNPSNRKDIIDLVRNNKPLLVQALQEFEQYLIDERAGILMDSDPSLGFDQATVKAKELIHKEQINNTISDELFQASALVEAFHGQSYNTFTRGKKQ